MLQFLASSTPAANLVVLLTLVLIFTVLTVVTVVGLWKVFKKAGRKGWLVLIPFCDGWGLAAIGGKPGRWALVGLVLYLGWPFSVVFNILIAIGISKRFGKSPWFCLVLFFLPF